MSKKIAEDWTFMFYKGSRLLYFTDPDTGGHRLSSAIVQVNLKNNTITSYSGTAYTLGAINEDFAKFWDDHKNYLRAGVNVFSDGDEMIELIE